MTLGADGAASAVPPLTAAASLLVETCATIAIQAARSGELDTARYLLEQALAALSARVKADL